MLWSRQVSLSIAEIKDECQAHEAREQRDCDAKDARCRKAATDWAAALDAYKVRHAAIHAVAITVLNIKVLVPVVQDHAANNYNGWCSLFLVILGKYALTDHILIDVVNANQSSWV